MLDRWLFDAVSGLIRMVEEHLSGGSQPNPGSGVVQHRPHRRRVYLDLAGALGQEAWKLVRTNTRSPLPPPPVISLCVAPANQICRLAPPGHYSRTESCITSRHWTLRHEFPRDHFNHPEFQPEWWYYTGNLRDAQGRRFGFLSRAMTETSSVFVRQSYPEVDISVPFDWDATAAEVTEQVRAERVAELLRS